jgi:hypothetical protein
MASDRLNREQADDVLSGRRPVRRGVPEGVEHVVAVLHASRELEPPPPMSQELRAQVHGARPAVDPLVPPAGDELPGVVRTARLRSARRAVASMAAAAALLVGVVLAATLPDGKAGRSDLGDTPSQAPAPASDSTTSTPTKTKPGRIGDSYTADTPPETEPEAEAPTSTAAPADSAPEATEPPAAPAPGDESGDRRDDGDRDGDADGRDGTHWDADRYGEDATDTTGDDEGVPETAPPTTSPDTTTTTTPPPDPGVTTTTTAPSWPDEWWWILDDAFRSG